ncbi:MAG TPA: DUF3102 domain-containing protein [Pirellulales bacterium]
MNHDLTLSGQGRPDDAERKLEQLAQRAMRAHENFQASMRQALAHALEAGQALLEAKALCPEGRWTKWRIANFRPSAGTARGYMRLATLWPQLGGDQQSIVDLTYTEALRLIRGKPNADGRLNTGRSAERRKLADPATSLDAANGRGEGGAEKTDGSVPRAEVADEPLSRFGQLLHLAIAELRRVVETQRSDSSYARHLLQPLERIHQGLASYRWHWDDSTPRR